MASTVARLKDKWNDELAQWRSRPLDDLAVYMLDGGQGFLRRRRRRYSGLAALSDGSKVV